MVYQVKAGILGLEDLGRAYAQLLKYHIKDLNLIGGVGKTQKELLFAKNDLSLQYVYSDDRSLLENHDIDAIFIFSELSQRPHLAIKAIEAGKHVFIADPIAMNYEDAYSLYKSADSRPSQVVMASSLPRFQPLINEVKTLVEKGELGIINHITIDSSFFKGLNRTYSKASGSPFLDSAVDEIDFCLWLMDEPIELVKVSANNYTIICDGMTRKSTSFSIIVHSDFHKEQSYLNIYGTKGQIILSNTNHKAFKLFKENGEKVDIYKDEANGFQFSEYLQLHHFARAVLGYEKAKVNTIHAKNLVQIAVALEKARALEQSIKLNN